KQNNQSKEVLERYIKKQLKNVDPAKTEHILNQSDFRFLNLRMVKELLLTKNDKTIDLTNQQHLFEHYLETIEKSYGKKFFQKLIEILCIVSTAYTPLTLNELTYLLGDDFPTFRLLANL